MFFLSYLAVCQSVNLGNPFLSPLLYFYMNLINLLMEILTNTFCYVSIDLNYISLNYIQRIVCIYQLNTGTFLRTHCLSVSHMRIHARTRILRFGRPKNVQSNDNINNLTSIFFFFLQKTHIKNVIKY